MQQTIVFVELENNKTTRQRLQQYVPNEQYKLQGTSMATAQSVIQQTVPQLVVIHLDQSNLEGIQLCKQIRQHSDIPVIFVHHKNDSSNVVESLDAGGDDYMKQPFEIGELFARIKVKLWRGWVCRELYEDNEHN